MKISILAAMFAALLPCIVQAQQVDEFGVPVAQFTPNPAEQELAITAPVIKIGQKCKKLDICENGSSCSKKGVCEATKVAALPPVIQLPPAPRENAPIPVAQECKRNGKRIVCPPSNGGYVYDLPASGPTPRLDAALKDIAELKTRPAPRNGVDGQNGKDGQDGAAGQDGQDGADGADGKDGVTPSDEDIKALIAPILAPVQGQNTDLVARMAWTQQAVVEQASARTTGGWLMATLVPGLVGGGLGGYIANQFGTPMQLVKSGPASKPETELRLGSAPVGALVGGLLSAVIGGGIYWWTNNGPPPAPGAIYTVPAETRVIPAHPEVRSVQPLAAPPAPQ